MTPRRLSLEINCNLQNYESARVSSSGEFESPEAAAPVLMRDCKQLLLALATNDPQRREIIERYCARLLDTPNGTLSGDVSARPSPASDPLTGALVRANGSLTSTEKRALDASLDRNAAAMQKLANAPPCLQPVPPSEKTKAEKTAVTQPAVTQPTPAPVTQPAVTQKDPTNGGKAIIQNELAKMDPAVRGACARLAEREKTDPPAVKPQTIRYDYNCKECTKDITANQKQTTELLAGKALCADCYKKLEQAKTGGAPCPSK